MQFFVIKFNEFINNLLRKNSIARHAVCGKLNTDWLEKSLIERSLWTRSIMFGGVVAYNYFCLSVQAQIRGGLSGAGSPGFETPKLSIFGPCLIVSICLSFFSSLIFWYFS